MHTCQADCLHAANAIAPVPTRYRRKWKKPVSAFSFAGVRGVGRGRLVVKPRFNSPTNSDTQPNASRFRDPLPRLVPCTAIDNAAATSALPSTTLSSSVPAREDADTVCALTCDGTCRGQSAHASAACKQDDSVASLQGDWHVGQDTARHDAARSSGSLTPLTSNVGTAVVAEVVMAGHCHIGSLGGMAPREAAQTTMAAMTVVRGLALVEVRSDSVEVDLRAGPAVAGTVDGDGKGIHALLLLVVVVVAANERGVVVLWCYWGAQPHTAPAASGLALHVTVRWSRVGTDWSLRVQTAQGSASTDARVWVGGDTARKPVQPSTDSRTMPGGLRTGWPRPRVARMLDESVRVPSTPPVAAWARSAGWKLLGQRVWLPQLPHRLEPGR